MRNLGLDILRLIAVILVLGRHLRLPSADNHFLTIWRTGGWIGVDLFFVLSGFLVSGLLFREFLRDQRVDLKRFLIRRGFKIYPAFYAFLLFTVSIRLFAGQEVRLKPLLGEIFFLQNYLGGLWNHTWSLAVEEHFYIGIAIFCFFAIRSYFRTKTRQNPFRIIPITFIIIAVFCLFMRIGNLFLFDSYNHKWFLFGTHIRMDSLMFGVLISYFWHFHDLESRVQNVRTLVLLVVGFMFLFPAFLFPLEQYKLISVFGVISFYLGSGVLVLAAVRLQCSRNRVLTLCGTFGAASYSIYLWHMPLATWGWDLVNIIIGIDDYIWYFTFYMTGSLILGLIMSKIIEWPVLVFRDRLFPKSANTIIPNNSFDSTTTCVTPSPSLLCSEQEPRQ